MTMPLLRSVILIVAGLLVLLIGVAAVNAWRSHRVAGRASEITLADGRRVALLRALIVSTGESPILGLAYVSMLSGGNRYALQQEAVSVLDAWLATRPGAHTAIAQVVACAEPGCLDEQADGSPVFMFRLGPNGRWIPDTTGGATAPGPFSRAGK